MKLLASVLDASNATVNTDGGSGGNDGADGRYIFGYNVSLGSGTKQNTQFRYYTGSAVSASEIYSPNPFLGSLRTPNIVGLVGGGEAFGLLPYSADQIFTDDILFGTAPDNVALAAIRLDGGWGYNYAGYDMLLIGNLSEIGWAMPMLGVESHPLTQLMTGSWQYDTRFGGSGTDPLLDILDAGNVYVTLVPEPTTASDPISITLGANVVGGQARTTTFDIRQNDVVYVTNSLIVPFTASEDSSESLVFAATASEPSVHVAVDGENLVITPEPGYKGVFSIDLSANDRSVPGSSDAGRSDRASFQVTVHDAVIQGVRYNDADGSSTLTSGEELEGAAVHVDIDDDGVVEFGEVIVSGPSGQFTATGLPTYIPEFAETFTWAIYTTLDGDQGWATEGQWEFGVPAGQGNSTEGFADPTAGSTGSNVYGVNLNGDYDTATGGPYYLTTNAIDLTKFDRTILYFNRWLNTEGPTKTTATVEISVDGDTWNTVYAAPSGGVRDDVWRSQFFDISSIADHQSTVYVRWGYSVDEPLTYSMSGWNIDDFGVYGYRDDTPPPPTFDVVPIGSASGDDPVVGPTVVGVGQILSLGDLGSMRWVEAGAAVVVSEGSSASISGEITRPADATLLEYRWVIQNEYGWDVTPDGVDSWVAIPTGIDVFAPILNFVPLDNGVYEVRLDIRGEFSDATPFSYYDVSSLTATPASPVVDLGDAITVDEGQAWIWPGMLNNTTSDAWQVDIDGDGDGLFETTRYVFNGDSPDFVYSWASATAGTPIEFRVRVTDLDESVFSEDTVLVTVQDAQPTLSQTSFVIFEGTSLEGLLQFRDGLDEWIVNVVYSDGEIETATIAVEPLDPSLKTIYLNRVFANEGAYTADVTIDDLTDGTTTIFSISITVNNQAPVIAGDIAASGDVTVGDVNVLDENLDQDPQWNLTGEWQFGAPAGQGGLSYGNPDPLAGATGDFVLGVNLAGDYLVAPGGPYYLVTDSIDLRGVTNAQLSFWRWLNTDYPPFVSATIDVSSDGNIWTNVYHNPPGMEVADAGWAEYTYDISEVADNQSTVYIRWGYQVAGGAWAYSGWNIDDITVSGTRRLASEGTDIRFSVAVTDVASDTLTYEWDFDYDGVTFDVDSTDENPTHQFPDEGVFTIAVRVSDGVATSSIRTQLYTVFNVAPVIHFDQAQTQWSEGDTLLFDGAAIVRDSAGDTVTYLWELLNKTGVVIHSGSNRTFSYPTTNEATYTLRLTAADENGSSSQETWPTDRCQRRAGLPDCCLGRSES